jgi:ABC-type multidrug transport system ATPase subunit
MKITLTNAGKRFNRDWIFRHVNYEFVSGHSYAITGPNGSGKSTFLQVIAGAMGLSEGGIEYELAVGSSQMTENNQPSSKSLSTVNSQTPTKNLPTEYIHEQLALAAPYLELIEEMTLTEFLEFHGKFKPFHHSFTFHHIMEAVDLGAAAHKQIRYFSSGMKQRVKLAQAIFSDTPLLLLDEPCTNLDADGIQMYLGLMKSYAIGKLVIISSNDKQEFAFCDRQVDMLQLR